jgi:hypothetical protein
MHAWTCLNAFWISGCGLKLQMPLEKPTGLSGEGLEFLVLLPNSTLLPTPEYTLLVSSMGKTITIHR